MNIADLLVSERDRLVAFFRRVGCARESEDLYQDLALSVLRRPPSDDVMDKRAWLYGAAKRVAAKSKAHRPHSSIGTVDPVHVQGYLERSELCRTLEKSLEGQKEPARSWLIRHHALEVALKELASEANTTPGAVAAMLARSRKQTVRSLDWATAQTLVAYGAQPTPVHTSVWCPRCGETRLALLSGNMGKRFSISCQSCCEDPLYLAEGRTAEVFQTEPEAGIELFLDQSLQNLQLWVRRRAFLCPLCGRFNDATPTAKNKLASKCCACQTESIRSNVGFALSLHRTRAFWKQHRRIRTEIGRLEIRFIARNGQAMRIELDPEFHMPSESLGKSKCTGESLCSS